MPPHYGANRKNNKLTVAEKQQLNGNDVIKLAGSGSLYLQQCVGPKYKGKNVSELQQAELTMTDQKEVCMFMLNW